MPITECKGYKSTPAALLNYITGKDETTVVSFRDVDSGRPLARQFHENHLMHGKGLEFDERKYYHLIVSWPKGAYISNDEMLEVTNSILEKFFPDHPSVTAIHDKVTAGIEEETNLHTHSCIDAVSLEKGKMVHMNQREYQALKDYANELGAELGFEDVDYRKPKLHRLTKSTRRVLESGARSWKVDLADSIVDAYNDTLDAYGTFSDFLVECEKKGVKLNEDGKWILKGHMPVGYSRLGEQYRPQLLFDNLTENYLNSLPEELREESKEIERKTSLMQRIFRAEQKKERQKNVEKKQLSPAQVEQLKEYYNARDDFWNGYHKAIEMATQELSKAYQSEENRRAFRDYRRAQYLFKKSFGIVTFSLSIIALVVTKSELKKEQKRTDHIKELRKELGLLSGEAMSLSSARKDAAERNKLSDELTKELAEQQKLIDLRVKAILGELEQIQLWQALKENKPIKLNSRDANER